MKPLTELQQETLQFVILFNEKTSRSPTYQEIADGFNISTSAAFFRITLLAEKGYLKQGRGHRGITVL